MEYSLVSHLAVSSFDIRKPEEFIVIPMQREIPSRKIRHCRTEAAQPSIFFMIWFDLCQNKFHLHSNKYEMSL